MSDCGVANELAKGGTRWQAVISLAMLVGAVLLGAPAVGSFEFSDFVPFLLALTASLLVAFDGLRFGTTWNRIASGISIILLLAVSACMALAVRI